MRTIRKLLHFSANAPWDDRAVRLVAARHAIEAMSTREPITTWIIDDTGFLKQGTHSVGVQRQYTGTAGKITNCQIGVTLSIATRSAHVPIDAELYLPESWTSDPKRRAECKIPDKVRFKTKHDLALDMITRAVEDGVPGDVLLSDSAYGDSHDFRERSACWASTMPWASTRRHRCGSSMESTGSEVIGKARGPLLCRSVEGRFAASHGGREQGASSAPISRSGA
jgi:SRSO17 transposase